MVSPSTPCVCFSPVGAGVKITKGWLWYGLGMVGLHGAVCSLVLISAKLWSVAGVVLTLLVSLKIILLKTNKHIQGRDWLVSALAATQQGQVVA